MSDSHKNLPGHPQKTGKDSPLFGKKRKQEHIEKIKLGISCNRIKIFDDESKLNELKKLRNAGLTYKELAKIFNANRNTISFALNKTGQYK